MWRGSRGASAPVKCSYGATRAIRFLCCLVGYRASDQRGGEMIAVHTDFSTELTP